MNYRVIFSILLLFIISWTSCVKPADQAKDDKLSLPKTLYNGNQLKVDGYYYAIFGNEITSFRFFYRNGIFINSGTPPNTTDFSQVDDYIKNHWGNIKNSKHHWGLFIINSNDIKIEQWHISNEGQNLATVRAGKILNDTTIHITNSYRMKDGQKIEVREHNETYYFHQYIPKPDSTNNFIP